MSGSISFQHALNPDNRPTVVLTFRTPQTTAHSRGLRCDPRLISQLAPEATLREMETQDEAACREAIAELQRLDRPLLLIDLGESSFINTLRLGQALKARAAAVARGGRCLAIVDSIDSAAADVIRRCHLQTLLPPHLPHLPHQPHQPHASPIHALPQF